MYFSNGFYQKLNDKQHTSLRLANISNCFHAEIANDVDSKTIKKIIYLEGRTRFVFKK